MLDRQRIKDKYLRLAHHLDEAALRVWAAVEAKAIGRGGVSRVAHAIGISRNTVYAGIRDLESSPDASANRLSGSSGKRRIRAPGGGRKKLIDKDSTLLRDLDALVEPTTRGDPESPLRWICKSTSALARQLKAMGHTVSPRSVSALLADRGYRLQSVRKTQEGRQPPDRDAQFRHIADETVAHQAAGVPVVAVDTKKKELIGDFKNNGREWQPPGGSACTISRIPTWARSRRMASTISRPIRAGSASGWITIPRSSRSKGSGAGGMKWASGAIQTLMS